MDNFFARVPMDMAARIEGMSRLSYELRENYGLLLHPHDVDDQSELLRRITAGETPEHPAYEHYLGACALRRSREAIRADLRALLADLTNELASVLVLPELAALLEEHCAAELDGPVRCHQDALLITLSNGVILEARFGADNEYAFNWRWGEAELRIDTAPMHSMLATFPHHLHDNVGVLRSDPVTDPARSPWENLRALVAALVADPLLRPRN